MKDPSLNFSKNPLLTRCSSAASASDAVMKNLADFPAFSNQILRNMFHFAGAFSCSIPRQEHSETDDEIKIIASILNKIAHRGTPSPCSIELEKYILSKAQDAGILNYSLDTNLGSIDYTCNFSDSSTKDYLKTCLYSQLLLNDNDTELLIEYYKKICTQSESYFLDQLTSKLIDKRLALFFTPQRTFSSMGIEDHPEERVDFACEIPFFDKNQWMKIVIEIDDSSHSGAQINKDLSRDRSLALHGWEIIRFSLKNKEEWNEKLNILSEKISLAIPQLNIYAIKHFRTFPEEKQRIISDLIYLPIAEAQISSSVALLLYYNQKKEIIVSDPQRTGIEPAIKSIQKTIDEIANLHAPSTKIWIRIAENGESPDIEYYRYPVAGVWDKLKEGKKNIISHCPVSSEYQEPIFRIKQNAIIKDIKREHPVDESLSYFLKNIFRKVEFREKQVEIITRALSLKPVIALLPTAAGKSLCYQMSAILQPGTTFIVDPLRSLMIDQVKNLESMGIHRSIKFMSGAGDYTTSDKEIREEGYRKFDRGEYYYIFSSPERLQIPDFINLINKNISNIPYCVVDEAHCVSEWGHDFRLSYMNVWRRMGEGMKIRPVFLALTGTASQNVLFDISEILQIKDPDSIIRPKNFNRNELNFKICQVSEMNRFENLAEIFDKLLKKFDWPSKDIPPGGLVFTNFTKGNLGIAEIAGILHSKTNLRIDMFSGSPPKEYKNEEWDKYKFQLQDDFKSNKISLITCTHAFGMGIDKPDIRFTIHSLLPRSIEDFYQQAGRAGRDGKPAVCVIIFVDQYPELSEKIIDTEHYSQSKIEQEMRKYDSERSDLIRNLWFWQQNFPGTDFEKDFLVRLLYKDIIVNIKNNSNPQTIDIPYLETDYYKVFDEHYKQHTSFKIENAIEKSLYRLYIIGAIRDYQKNYTDKKFVVDATDVQPDHIYEKLEKYLLNHVSKSEMLRFVPKERKETYFDAAMDCGYAFIDFFYEYVEKRRRRSIGHMLRAVQTGKDNPGQFRDEILGYLEESEFSDPVKKLAKNDNLDNFIPLIIDIRERDYSRIMYIKLLGACRKELEEFPNNPGLLILSGLSSVLLDENKKKSEDLEINRWLDIKNGFTILKRNITDDEYQAVKNELLNTIKIVKPDIFQEINQVI